MTNHDTDQHITPDDSNEIDNTTDSHITNDQTDTPATPPEDTDEHTTADGDLDDGQHETNPRLRKANKEAARYRAQLREVEADRDAMATRVAGLERAILDHVNPFADVISVDGLMKLGMDPAAYVDKDGGVDVDAMAADVRDLALKFGLHKSSLPYVESVGWGSNGLETEANWLRTAKSAGRALHRE